MKSTSGSECITIGPSRLETVKRLVKEMIPNFFLISIFNIFPTIFRRHIHSTSIKRCLVDKIVIRVNNCGTSIVDHRNGGSHSKNTLVGRGLKIHYELKNNLVIKVINSYGACTNNLQSYCQQHKSHVSVFSWVNKLTHQRLIPNNLGRYNRQ